MPVPSDTISEDVLELPTWYCMSCKSILKGEIDEDIFLGICHCERKWYIQIPRRAGYFLESSLLKKHEKPVAKDKRAS